MARVTPLRDKFSQIFWKAHKPPSCVSHSTIRNVSSKGYTLEIDPAELSNQLRLAVRERLRAYMPYVDKSAEFWRASDLHGRFRLPEADSPLDTIRSWLLECDSSHGECCHGGGRLPFNGNGQGYGPRWLVDVHKLWLVRAQPDMSYFALSYVWGGSRLSKVSATTSNLSELQKDGALGTNALPRTIRDAVSLVRSLQGNYIWVDCLCIVQDDAQHKQGQLNSMCQIYAHAVATIVAAAGLDAEAGLGKAFEKMRGNPGERSEIARPGLQDVLHSPGLLRTTTGSRVFPAVRNSQTRRFQSFEHRDRAIGTLGLSHDIMIDQMLDLVQSKWYSRGWTFQEALFSRRKIVFQGDTVNWECGYAAWAAVQGPVEPRWSMPVAADSETERTSRAPTTREDSDSLCTGTSNLEMGSGLLPDFHRFARLVSLFNKRDLTFPEDVLDAFAGTITTISSQYHGGFISGLPQAFFDSALIWQPWEEAVRRKATKSSNEDSSCLLSWSWAGWQCDVDSESLRSGYDYMKESPDEFLEYDRSVWEPSSWHTTSTVKWHYIDDSGQSHPIEVRGQRYRDAALESNSNMALPSGWSRHTCAKSGKPFFRYDSDGSKGFWYPIPLNSPAQTQPPHIQANFLSTRTRRAFLWIGPPERLENKTTTRCKTSDLLDDSWEWKGVLRHSSEETARRLMGTKQEFIELSAGTVLNQETEAVSFDEWNTEECPRRSGRYDFYNVMAVERVDGVACRLGVGRVEKRAWEDLAKEEVDIVIA